jgi:hypothetical protein
LPRFIAPAVPLIKAVNSSIWVHRLLGLRASSRAGAGIAPLPGRQLGLGGRPFPLPPPARVSLPGPLHRTGGIAAADSDIKRTAPMGPRGIHRGCGSTVTMTTAGTGKGRRSSPARSTTRDSSPTWGIEREAAIRRNRTYQKCSSPHRKGPQRLDVCRVADVKVREQLIHMLAEGIP